MRSAIRTKTCRFPAKKLRQSYQQVRGQVRLGAAKSRTRSMRENNKLIGWGIAGGAWEAMQETASGQSRFDRRRQAQPSPALPPISAQERTR